MLLSLNPMLRHKASTRQFDVSIVEINDDDYRDYLTPAKSQEIPRLWRWKSYESPTVNTQTHDFGEK